MKRLVRTPPVIVALLSFLASTTLLALIVVPHSTTVYPDTVTYMGGALNLIHGRGIYQQVYDLQHDSIIPDPITRYPPLTSMVYAALLFVGVPVAAVPSVVALIAWVCFLAGLAVLTYRLSRSLLLVALVVVLATFTESYLRVFVHGISEVLFLPLLVWLLVLLVDLPTHPNPRAISRRLLAVVVLLTLLMLTRYVGVIFAGVVVLWWIWWRLWQQRARWLKGELPLFALSGVPLLVWLLRNSMLTGGVLGKNASPSRETFQEGLLAVLQESRQIVLPTRPDALAGLREWGNFEAVMPFVHLPLLILLVGVLIWRWVYLRIREDQSWLRPPRSPLLLSILAYVGLYTFVQPFFLFSPIDWRDTATLLSLTQPFVLIAAAQLFAGWRAKLVLSTYVVCSLGLVFTPIVTQGIPQALRLNPPQITNFYHDPAAMWHLRRQAVPWWLTVGPFRIATIPRHHPEVLSLLREADADTAVISNVKTVPLFYIDIERRPPVRVNYEERIVSLERWLDHGTCMPRVNVALVLLQGHSSDEELAQYAADIEAKCPALHKTTFDGSTVYVAGPAWERGHAQE